MFRLKLFLIRMFLKRGTVNQNFIFIKSSFLFNVEHTFDPYRMLSRFTKTFTKTVAAAFLFAVAPTFQTIIYLRRPPSRYQLIYELLLFYQILLNLITTFLYALSALITLCLVLLCFIVYSVKTIRQPIDTLMERSNIFD